MPLPPLATLPSLPLPSCLAPLLLFPALTGVVTYVMKERAREGDHTRFDLSSLPLSHPFILFSISFCILFLCPSSNFCFFTLLSLDPSFSFFSHSVLSLCRPKDRTLCVLNIFPCPLLMPEKYDKLIVCIFFLSSSSLPLWWLIALYGSHFFFENIYFYK